ncbi:MAG: trp operon repressor [Chlamydiales bacterium]
MNLCKNVRTLEEFDRVFGLFFTIEEQESLAARYLIIKALLEGRMTQRKIAERYKVSIAQITRGSNALKIIGDELKKFLIKELANDKHKSN